MNKIQDILNQIGKKYETDTLVMKYQNRKKFFVFNSTGELIEEFSDYRSCSLRYNWKKIQNSIKNKAVVNGLYFSHTKVFDPLILINKPKLCSTSQKVLIIQGSQKLEFESMSKASRYFGVHIDMFRDYKNRSIKRKIPRKLNRIGVTKIEFVESN